MSVYDSTGARFAKALAAKDFDQIATLLHPGIDFRALTPNQSWKARGPEEVIGDVLRRWLEDGIELERLSDLRVEEFSNCQRVAYRLHGHDLDRPFLIDQQAYLEESEGRITWMRLLCSGFRSPSSNGLSSTAPSPGSNQEATAAWVASQNCCRYASGAVRATA
jgi:hypothetical protein